MPLHAIALVILAALIHATWNIATKKAQGDARFMLFTNVLNTLIWAPLIAYLGLDEVYKWRLRDWCLVATSAVLHWLYFWFLLRGYKRADLTVVYPIARGSGPLITALVAILLLGEALHVEAVLGIGIVVIGVFFIAGGPKLWRVVHAADAVTAARVRVGIRYGFITGCFIASYTLVDGYAVKFLLLSPIFLDYFGNLLRTPLLLPLAWQARASLREQWRSQWRYAVIVAGLSPVGYVMVMYAMQIAPLSKVAPARELSMLFAALIGGHLLGESDRKVRVIGATAIAIGVAVLALSR